jgi:hypothetical protein
MSAIFEKHKDYLSLFQEHKQPEPEQKPFELSDDQVAALDDQVALAGEA